MIKQITPYKDRLFAEIEATPDEYLPALLNIVRLYRQSVSLNPADISFAQGWQEALDEGTFPISSLWVSSNEELIEQAHQLSGLPTKQAIVEEALYLMIQHDQQLQVRQLRGKLNWEGNLDEMRENGFNAIGVL
ncbi:MAG: type II toxin-antitoxin system VapB family antitoxin [Chloroflexota bacterium]